MIGERGLVVAKAHPDLIGQDFERFAKVDSAAGTHLGHGGSRVVGLDAIAPQRRGEKGEAAAGFGGLVGQHIRPVGGRGVADQLVHLQSAGVGLGEPHVELASDGAVQVHAADIDVLGEHDAVIVRDHDLGRTAPEIDAEVGTLVGVDGLERPGVGRVLVLDPYGFELGDPTPLDDAIDEASRGGEADDLGARSAALTGRLADLDEAVDDLIEITPELHSQCALDQRVEGDAVASLDAERLAERLCGGNRRDQPVALETALGNQLRERLKLKYQPRGVIASEILGRFEFGGGDEGGLGTRADLEHLHGGHAEIHADGRHRGVPAPAAGQRVEFGKSTESHNCAPPRMTNRP